MKRIAAIFAAVVAFGVVPSVAAAGNGATLQRHSTQQITKQVTKQVVAQRVSRAITAQRVKSQQTHTARFTHLLTPRMR